MVTIMSVLAKTALIIAVVLLIVLWTVIVIVRRVRRARAGMWCDCGCPDCTACPSRTYDRSEADLTEPVEKKPKSELLLKK